MVSGVCKNIEQWSIECHVTKAVEQIVMDLVADFTYV